MFRLVEMAPGLHKLATSCVHSARDILHGLLMLSATASGAGQNYHYQCTLEEQVRLVEVAYLLADQAVPCEVRHQKNQGETKVLWRADNKEGFCERKARQFVEKQRQWGFSCKSDNLPEKIRQANQY